MLEQRRSSSPLHARDPMLDGLRGAAALAVVYVHYLFYSGLTAMPGAGQVGVLVFFVLSGYLITRMLWRTDGRAPTSYRAFLSRRVRRLFPALLGVVLVAGPVMTWVGPERPDLAVRSALIVLAQATAYFWVAGSFPLEPWFPTWSLSVEWAFYLLWPLALVLMRRLQLSTMTAMRVTFALAGLLYVASLPLSPDAFYVLPVANIAVMLVGAGIALAHRADPRRARGRDAGVADLAFLLLLVVIFFPSTGASGVWLYRVTYFPVAVLAAAAVIDQRPGTGGLARRLLESRPMVGIGWASYSLYLWHLPILWTAWWGLPGLPAVGRVGVALAVLVPIVWLSFTFLEKPVLRPAVRRPSTDVEHV